MVLLLVGQLPGSWRAVMWIWVCLAVVYTV